MIREHSGKKWSSIVGINTRNLAKAVKFFPCVPYDGHLEASATCSNHCFPDNFAKSDTEQHDKMFLQVTVASPGCVVQTVTSWFILRMHSRRRVNMGRQKKINLSAPAMLKGISVIHHSSQRITLPNMADPLAPRQRQLLWNWDDKRAVPDNRRADLSSAQKAVTPCGSG